jgi:hypothetical protein
MEYCFINDFLLPDPRKPEPPDLNAIQSVMFSFLVPIYLNLALQNGTLFHHLQILQGFYK